MYTQVFSRNEVAKTAQNALKAVLVIDFAIVAMLVVLSIADSGLLQYYAGGIATALLTSVACSILLFDLENYKRRQGRWRHE